MKVDTVKSDSVSKPAAPTLSVEQLGVLLQDLHELLESHAPQWCTTWILDCARLWPC